MMASFLDISERELSLDLAKEALRDILSVPGIDAAYIKQVLGDFPLIGMFGGYELAPLGRANHLFAYTGVLVLVAE